MSRMLLIDPLTDPPCFLRADSSLDEHSTGPQGLPIRGSPQASEGLWYPSVRIYQQHRLVRGTRQGQEKTRPTGLTADGLLCYMRTHSTAGVVIAPVNASGCWSAEAFSIGRHLGAYQKCRCLSKCYAGSLVPSTGHIGTEWCTRSWRLLHAVDAAGSLSRKSIPGRKQRARGRGTIYGSDSHALPSLSPSSLCTSPRPIDMQYS
jgi:hypothetical protein